MTMTPPSTGTIALVGSGEFLPPILPLDQKLLAHIQGEPRVVVIPTASAPDGPGVPERWAKMGVEHFGALGAQVEAVLLLTQEDAKWWRDRGLFSWRDGDGHSSVRFPEILANDPRAQSGARVGRDSPFRRNS
jgi:hypothetical protein